MFDLEKAIADWRRQMLTTGIKTPAPLDELESHLREEVDLQARSGVSASQAFEIAASRMGRADVLKTEFAKARGFWGFLGGGKSAKANRILGALWLTGCAGSLNTVCRQFIPPHPPGASPDTFRLFMSVMAVFVYGAGIVGSVFLFRGAKWGRSIVRMLALLMAIVCVAQILNFGTPGGWRMWCGVVAAFSLVSIWLLHVPEVTNSNPNTAAQ